MIVGSAAGALTGLQFVVIALTTHRGSVRRTEESLHAFGTPTVVHFGSILLAAAIVVAPWTSLTAPAVALRLCGAGGIGYTIVVILRAVRQSAYAPVLEDWVWHAAAPMAAYACEVGAALALPAHAGGALFWLGGATMLLLVTGIHNAWDAAAYIAVTGGRGAAAGEDADAEGAAPPPAPRP